MCVKKMLERDEIKFSDLPPINPLTMKRDILSLAMAAQPLPRTASISPSVRAAIARFRAQGTYKSP